MVYNAPDDYMGDDNTLSLIPVTEAAIMIGIGRATLWRWIKRGQVRVKPFRTGRPGKPTNAITSADVRRFRIWWLKENYMRHRTRRTYD